MTIKSQVEDYLAVERKNIVSLILDENIEGFKNRKYKLSELVAYMATFSANNSSYNRFKRFLVYDKLNKKEQRDLEATLLLPLFEEFIYGDDTLNSLGLTLNALIEGMNSVAKGIQLIPKSWVANNGQNYFYINNGIRWELKTMINGVVEDISSSGNKDFDERLTKLNEYYTKEREFRAKIDSVCNDIYNRLVELWQPDFPKVPKLPPLSDSLDELISQPENTNEEQHPVNDTPDIEVPDTEIDDLLPDEGIPVETHPPESEKSEEQDTKESVTTEPETQNTAEGQEITTEAEEKTESIEN